MSALCESAWPTQRGAVIIAVCSTTPRYQRGPGQQQPPSPLLAPNLPDCHVPAMQPIQHSSIHPLHTDIGNALLANRPLLPIQSMHHAVAVATSLCSCLPFSASCPSSLCSSSGFSCKCLAVIQAEHVCNTHAQSRRECTSVMCKAHVGSPRDL